jgi:hypothetical protein
LALFRTGPILVLSVIDDDFEWFVWRISGHSSCHQESPERIGWMWNMLNLYMRPWAGCINLTPFDDSANESFVATNYVSFAFRGNPDIQITNLFAMETKVAESAATSPDEQGYTL